MQEQPCASTCSTKQQPVCGWGTRPDRTLASATSRRAPPRAMKTSTGTRPTGAPVALASLHLHIPTSPRCHTQCHCYHYCRYMRRLLYPGVKKTRAAKADAEIQPQPMQRSRGNRCRSQYTTQTLSQHMHNTVPQVVSECRSTADNRGSPANTKRGIAT